MTLKEQIRQKFEQENFNAVAVINWIMSQHVDIEKKKKAFFILASFPEYGEPEINNTLYVR